MQRMVGMTSGIKFPKTKIRVMFTLSYLTEYRINATMRATKHITIVSENTSILMINEKLDFPFL